jgi:hypothetical protein
MARHRWISGLHVIRAALSAASIIGTFIGALRNKTEMMGGAWESGRLGLITAVQNLLISRFAKFA